MDWVINIYYQTSHFYTVCALNTLCGSFAIKCPFLVPRESVTLAHILIPSAVLFFSIFSWKQFGKTWPLFDVVGADRLWWPPLSFFFIRAISSSRGQGGESRNPPGPEASKNHVTPPPPLQPHACFDGLGDCCSTFRKENVNWKWKNHLLILVPWPAWLYFLC